MASAQLSVSLTETPQYRRLVQFIGDVADLARERGDYELQKLVDDAYEDLLKQSIEED